MSNPSKCCDCQATLKPCINPFNGGTFLACSNFKATGCRVTWSLSNKTWNGSKLTLARASKTRGQAKDAMAVVKKLALLNNVPFNDALTYVQTHGVDEALRLMSA